MQPAQAIAPEAQIDVGALFETHAEELCRLAHRMTGSRELAEEVVQDVFITAWKRREDVQGMANPRAWLYRVALNHLRHRKRSFARRLNFLDRWRTRPDAAGPALPDAAAESVQRAERVHQTVARLSPGQREVFVLFELQGLSGQEVAEILEIKTNTVWSRLRLGRERFRELWDPEVEP